MLEPMIRVCLSAAIAEAEDRNRDEQLEAKVAKEINNVGPADWEYLHGVDRDPWLAAARAAIAAVEEHREGKK